MLRKYDTKIETHMYIGQFYVTVNAMRGRAARCPRFCSSLNATPLLFPNSRRSRIFVIVARRRCREDSGMAARNLRARFRRWLTIVASGFGCRNYARSDVTYFRYPAE